MLYNEVFEIIKRLEYDKKRVIYTEGGVELYVYRPSKVSKRFKDYEVEKNFQVWLNEGNGNEFRPNHLRAMIDLNLRVRSRLDLKKELLIAFDKIYYHEDPDLAIIKLICPS